MSFVYFTDRDLGNRFPAILEEAGLRVERHASHFNHSTPDEEWLAEVGERGWVAVTHDARIRYKPNERDAVVAHGVSLVVVRGRAPFPELARAFAGSIAQIEAFLAAHRPPFIAKFNPPSPSERSRNPLAPGRIEKWYPRP